jgi:NIMA-interacting peptidyl-prolyl cis-trans isomerase 1
MRRIWWQAVWIGLTGALLLGCDQTPEPPAAAPAEAPATPSAQPAAKAPAATSSARSAAAGQQQERVEPTEVAAQHILVSYRGAKRASREVTRTKSQAKARAEEVAAKAKQGADFSELAGEYSDCPSKTNRGNLGKFKRESMDPKFSAAAFELEVGQVSEVVETPFGFHIIKRNQ